MLGMDEEFDADDWQKAEEVVVGSDREREKLKLNMSDVMVMVYPHPQWKRIGRE